MLLPRELSDLLGLALYVQLKKVAPDVGAALLRDKDLTPEQYQSAIALCKPSAPAPAPGQLPGRLMKDFTHMRATLWICGVSYYQMAILAGVSQAAIRQSILRVLTPEERARYSGRTGQIVTHGEASALHTAYSKHAVDMLGYTPEEASVHLNKIVGAYRDE